MYTVPGYGTNTVAGEPKYGKCGIPYAAYLVKISSRISKFQLPNGECISCVLWNGLYHVTGTDIGKFHSHDLLSVIHHGSSSLFLVSIKLIREQSEP